MRYSSGLHEELSLGIWAIEEANASKGICRHLMLMQSNGPIVSYVANSGIDLPSCSLVEKICAFWISKAILNSCPEAFLTVFSLDLNNNFLMGEILCSAIRAKLHVSADWLGD